MTRLAVIGNGLYVSTAAKESLLGQYLRKQAACLHIKRDPKGTCYACGKKEAPRG